MNQITISSSSIPLKDNYHTFHLVQPSVWPLVTALWAGYMAVGAVLYMHYSIGLHFIVAFTHLLGSLIGWWRDVIQESFYNHTAAVQRGLRLGFILFIVSEIMFFFGFFWTFLHSSVSPSVFIGCQWPPRGIEPFNPWTIPLINTLILLLSGASITWVHHAIVAGKRSQSHYGFLVTIALAIFFTALQVFEYREAPFGISDGIFGACFFMMTGFHGFHVVIGTIFIIVCAFRSYYGHFTISHHLGFEAAAWYWHFVDVVWLFLFVLVYWWGGLQLINDSTFVNTLNF
jgi:heme/copper-type cytochrome/quinol oxidase subunit 3